MPFDHPRAGHGPGDPGAHDLRHHGDAEVADGLLDFAVNVVGDGPPAWLRDRLAATLDGLGRYPRAGHDDRAREVAAARHGRTRSRVATRPSPDWSARKPSPTKTLPPSTS